GPGVRLGPRGIRQSRLSSLARPHDVDRFDGHDVGHCLRIGTQQFGSSNRHAFSEQRDGGFVDLVFYGDWLLRKRGWARSLRVSTPDLSASLTLSEGLPIIRQPTAIKIGGAASLTKRFSFTGRQLTSHH